MVKCFYKTREELSTACNPNVMSRCLAAPDGTSLHQCLQNHCQNFNILSFKSALDTNRPVERGFRLFQLQGGIISHMLVIATPSSTVHNTNFLDPYN